ISKRANRHLCSKMPLASPAVLRLLRLDKRFRKPWDCRSLGLISQTFQCLRMFRANTGRKYRRNIGSPPNGGSAFRPAPWDGTASISSGKNAISVSQKSLSYADLRLTYPSSGGILPGIQSAGLRRDPCKFIMIATQIWVFSKERGLRFLATVARVMRTQTTCATQELTS